MGEGKSWKREVIGDFAVVAIVLLIIGGGTLGLQFYLGTPTPLWAVESGSMEPVFYRGDLVIVRAVDPVTLEVGDIIIFDAPFVDVPVVHRIIEIELVNETLRFTTKGDNNPSADMWSPITADKIIAKVIGTVRYLGFIALFVLIPGAIYPIILLIVIFLFLSILCDSSKSQKSESKTDKTGKIEKQPGVFLAI
ncbi:MAG: signal peptidase I [Promethearchaeota archaeon]